MSATSVLAFEDFKPGPFGSFGPRRVTREEIVEFATEFDPQPMHLDEEAAKQSLLGGLAASGWHMAAIQIRMMCDAFLNNSTSLGGPGIEELRWVAPLRPDTDVMMDVEVLESRLSKSRPGIGLVHFKFTFREQAGKTLMTQMLWIMFRCRDAVQG